MKNNVNGICKKHGEITETMQFQVNHEIIGTFCMRCLCDYLKNVIGEVTIKEKENGKSNS